MTSNPVSNAIDLVDDEPTAEFLSTLRAQLLVDLVGSNEPGSTASPQRGSPMPPVEEYVTLAPDPARVGPSRRVVKIVLAAAACVALLAAAVVIRTRSNTADVLSDVDQQAALPLARAALISPDALGARWTHGFPVSDSDVAEQALGTVASHPKCAALTSFGLLPPTTKSVAVRQSLSPGGREEHAQTVFVFATPEDASRAMDFIAGDVFPTCSFDLFDRLTPLGGYPDERSISKAWEPPQVTPQGDRLVVVGQQIDYDTSDGSVEVFVINTYVQVGRAISWTNPLYGAGQTDRLVTVNEAITATAAALERVFGR